MYCLHVHHLTSNRMRIDQHHSLTITFCFTHKRKKKIQYYYTVEFLPSKISRIDILGINSRFLNLSHFFLCLVSAFCLLILARSFFVSNFPIRKSLVASSSVYLLVLCLLCS